MLCRDRDTASFVASPRATNVSRRSLTFAERVAYQQAIEEVYWRHRIWPKERPDPKPSLDAVMSQPQLEKKVSDYLRKSQALEDYWQRPLTAEQLQAEMDRMAKHTRQPEVLRELFEALGNDPFVIAECLARPALADRLLTNWYAYDQRLHGELKQRVKSELRAHNTVDQMKQLCGKYSEIDLVRSDSANGKKDRSAGHTVKLNSREWEAAVKKLAATYGGQRRVSGFENADISVRWRNAAYEAYEILPIGELSSLQEDESRYYATAVTQNSNGHLKLATVAWIKEPLESWLTTVQDAIPNVLGTAIDNYRLPKISDGGCFDDTWAVTSGPPDGREGHTAVWTGSEMIVWGGEIYPILTYGTGGRYNPSMDTWTDISTTDAPTPRALHTAVWTGSEMIVWGGLDQNGFDLNIGGKYNPGTDSWIATGTTNAPQSRDSHTAVWIGSEMIVWAGFGQVDYVNSGGRYNPNTNSWTTTSTINAPDGRENHTAVWTGNEMIVWGGFIDLNTGGRYNPTTDSWTATSTTNAPDGRDLHSAVWSGSQMIIWGGESNSFCCSDTGGRYNPTTNSWTATSTLNTPSARRSQTAVWTGSEMIIWGGYNTGITSTGGRYNPATNSWTNTGTNNAPSPRVDHTAVWTGTEMIVWGGFDDFDTNTGGRYQPSTDNWIATNTASPPAARFFH